MKIQDTSLLDLIPECMRNDRIIKGFAAAWDYLKGEVTKVIPLVNLFDYLELLTSEQLDEVAEAMAIDWYSTEYTKEKKIDLIRHYELVCFKLGTVGSILSVARDIYGIAWVTDWYDYDSPQWRFKITVDFGDYTTEEALRKLTRIVRSIKPAKATLNPVEFLSNTDQEMYVAETVVTNYFFPPIYDADMRYMDVHMGAVMVTDYYFPAICGADIAQSA